MEKLKCCKQKVLMKCAQIFRVNVIICICIESVGRGVVKGEYLMIILG